MNKKMKILELSSVDITLYRFVLPLMKEMGKEGFEVIAAAKDLGYLSKIMEEGFKTYALPMTRSLNPIAITKAIIEVYKLLKRERIDIIHVHTPIASFIGRIAAVLARVKIKVYTVHGFRINNKLFYLIEKFMAKYFTDFIFTVNNEDMVMAIENKFITKNKIINLNSVGIDVNKFNPGTISECKRSKLKKDIGLQEKDEVIGFIGRIVKEKGVLDLIKAYIQVKKKLSLESEFQQLKLLLVGPWNLGERDNKTINEVNRIIINNNLQNNILLLGYREDIPELLSIIDIFVLPSYREGMPVSLLEAMAMERPVIATNIRGCREEITEETGMLFEPKDIKALSLHLEYLIVNKEIAKEMGKRARKRVVENFSQQKVISKQIQAFKWLTRN